MPNLSDAEVTKLLDKILGPRKPHKPIDLDATLAPKPVPVRKPEPSWTEKALGFLRHGATRNEGAKPEPAEPPRFMTDSLTPNEEGLPSTPIYQPDSVEIKAQRLSEAVRMRTQQPPYVPDQPAWQQLDPGLRQNDVVPQVTYGQNKLAPRGLWQGISQRIPGLLRQQGEYYENLTPEQRLAYQLSGPQKGLIRFGEGLAKAVHLDKVLDTENMTEKALGIPEVPGSGYLEAAGQISGELGKYATLLKVTYPLLGKPAAQLAGKAIGKVVNPLANRFAMWASTVVPQATGAGAALAGATAINEVLKGKENELDDKAKNVLDSFLFGFVFSGVVGTVKPYIDAARMNRLEGVREIYPKSEIWVNNAGKVIAAPTNHRNLNARKDVVRMIMDTYGKNFTQTPEMLSSGAQMMASGDIPMTAPAEGAQQALQPAQGAVPAALQAGTEAAQQGSRIAIPMEGVTPPEAPPEAPIEATGEVAEPVVKLNETPVKATIEQDLEQKISALEKVAADSSNFDLQMFAKGRIKEYQDLLKELREKGVSEDNIKRVQELLKMEDAAEQLKQDYAKKQEQGVTPKVRTAKERKITTAQMKRMFALAKGDEELVKDIAAKHGFASRADITQDKYDQICNEIRGTVNRTQKPPKPKQIQQDAKPVQEAKDAEPPKIRKDPELGYSQVTAGEIAEALGIDIPEEQRSEVVGHLFDDKVFSLLDKPIDEWSEDDIRLVVEEANAFDATLRPGWRTIPRPITEAVVAAKKEANIYADKHLARYKEATAGLTDEQKQQVALILDGKAPAEGELAEVAAKVRTILDSLFNDMVQRGLMDPDRYIENYYSHIQEELDPKKATQGLGTAPSPWMTKQRTGGEEYDLDMDRVIARYINTVSKNMFIRPVQEQYQPVINEMGPMRQGIVDKFFRAAYGQPQNEEVLLNNLIKDASKLIKQEVKSDRPSAEVSRFMISLIVQRSMGLNPVTAIRNYTQKLLAIAEVADKKSPLRGFKYFAKAQKFLRTAEGKEFVRKYNALRQQRIYYEYLENVAEIGGKLTKALDKAGEATMWMFSQADLSNVDHAFLYGVWAALDDGKTIAEAIEYGNKVAVDTQFAYDIRRAPISHGPAGKLFALFTSYAQNFGELFWAWLSKGQWQSVLMAIASLVAADYLLEKMLGVVIRLNPKETVEGHLVAKMARREPTVVRDYITDMIQASDKLVNGEVGEWKKGLEEFLYLAPGGNQLKRTVTAVRAALNDYQVEGSYGRTDTLNGFSEAFRSVFGQTVEAQTRWEIGRDYYEAIKAEVDPSFADKLLEPVKGDLKQRIQELNAQAETANLNPRKLFDNAISTLRREYYELSEKAILRDRQEDMKEIVKIMRRLGVTRKSFKASMSARGIPLAKYSKWLNYLPK